ncbi:MIP/aquaporin family protein [Hymenobacter nivis]|uniref:Aquaporin family protein n=1 Tax=Hymenobacter nivis TaxID=1850093 RepID=A0A502GTS6_9BACT|nr:aquaporin [Hymenobacter nivis]TPG65629.1 aquaporin family protein [Hymenobacter nivis]
MGFARELLPALRRHWPYYLAEAAGPAAFLVVSSATAVIFHHPNSAVARALGPSELVQRVGLGLVIAGLIMAMAYSPWGKRSGAHFNPAVTLGFWRLGHIRTADAAWYVLAQFAGALGAGFLMFNLLQQWFGYPAIHYNITRPITGDYGWLLALGAEIGISAVFLLVLLGALHSARFKGWAGALSGLMLAVFIVFESPLSGMSLNPARSTGTAVAAQLAPALWVYFAGPLLAMWAAAAWFGHYRARQALPERPPLYPDPTA